MYRYLPAHRQLCIKARQISTVPPVFLYGRYFSNKAFHLVAAPLRDAFVEAYVIDLPLSIAVMPQQAVCPKSRKIPNAPPCGICGISAVVHSSENWSRPTMGGEGPRIYRAEARLDFPFPVEPESKQGKMSCCKISQAIETQSVLGGVEPLGMPTCECILGLGGGR